MGEGGCAGNEEVAEGLVSVLWNAARGLAKEPLCSAMSAAFWMVGVCVC